MKLSILLTITLLSGLSTQAGPPEAACLSGSGLTEVIPLDESVTFGMYTRVHPAGDFIIGTGNGSFIVDLRERGPDGIRKPRNIRTPGLLPEAYATEGSWAFVASARHRGNGGPAGTHMKFFDFNELVETNGSATAIVAKNESTGLAEQFTDVHVNNYYQTAADLPSTDPTLKRFRTVQYSSLEFSDFETKVDANGKVTSFKRTKTGTLCQNLGIPGSSTPILSKDGTEVALHTMIGDKLGTYIFKIGENGNCEVADYVTPEAVKGNFSYPTPGSRGRYVFLSSGYDDQGRRRSGIAVYNRDTKATEWIEPKTVQFGNGGAYSYPGFMKDGRIMVGQQYGYDRALVVTKVATGAPEVDCEPCKAAAAAQAANVEKLGKLWRDICHRLSSPGPEFTLQAGKLPIDSKSCRSLVEKFFDQKLASGVITGVTKDDLLATCGLGA